MGSNLDGSKEGLSGVIESQMKILLPLSSTSPLLRTSLILLSSLSKLIDMYLVLCGRFLGTVAARGF